MAVLSDTINEIQRLIDPTPRYVNVTLGATATAGTTSLSFTDTSAGSINTQSIVPGTVMSCDLELFLVTGSPSGGVVSVSPGYLGSTKQNHANGTLAYARRRFSDFECVAQINHVLDELAGEGLYNLAEVEVTYNAVQQAYDLTDVNTSTAITNYIEGVAARYRTPLPDRKYRTIPANHWEVLPMGSTSVDTQFPSGYQFILNDSGWPGQNILFLFKQGFNHFTTSTTPATDYGQNIQTVTGLPATCNDLLPMGAMLRMVPPREVPRNQMQAQQDSRLAPEVPPQAIASSVNAVRSMYVMRIGEEKARLKRTLGHVRRRY